MPYEIRKKENEYCVMKQGTDEQMACHATEEEAMAQMRALYANETGEKAAVKFAATDENTIEGLGMPYGGPSNGQDLAGEHFSKSTDFCEEWYAARPLLFHHGLNKDAGVSVIGTVTAWKKTDLGMWVSAQLDAHNEFVDGVKELVRKGALFFSSGAMGHLVRKDAKSGEIKVWPWVELSMTPTPCNLLATLDFATAKSHFKAIDVELPEEQVTVTNHYTLSMYGSPNASDLELLKLASTDMPEEMQGEEKPMCSICGKKPAMTGKKTCKECADEAPKKASDFLNELIDEDIDLRDVPIAVQAEAVKILATSLMERTKDLRERRVKEGRQLSASTRKRMKESMDAMRGVLDEMCAFLDSTEPQTAKAASVRLQLDLLKLYAATLS